MEGLETIMAGLASSGMLRGQPCTGSNAIIDMLDAGMQLMALIMVSHVIQIKRRLDKEVTDGGE